MSEAAAGENGVDAVASPAPPLTLVRTGLIDFQYLAHRAGSPAGGRELFEKLALQLIKLDHPQAQNVRPMPGDWGIDGFVGELDDVVSIWQAKYFIERFDTSQKSQITKSIKKALKAAAKNGYKVKAWTLCVPIDLEADAHVWFTKLKRELRKAGVICQLWAANDLERFMLREDGEAIRRYFFPSENDAEPLRPIEDLPDANTMESSLFVKQLREAGTTQLKRAKIEFFNAEIMSRDVHAKRDARELDELISVRGEVHSRWAHRFDAACETETTDPVRLPGLRSRVMTAIEDGFNASPPKVLRTRVLHHFGIAHQLCDEGEIGWVRDYQRLVDEHAS